MSVVPAEPRSPMVSGAGPWLPRDVHRAGRSLGGGLLAGAYAWYRAADLTQWPDMAPWIALAVGSVLLAAAGLGSWLLSGFQHVAAERHTVLAHMVVAARRPTREPTAALVTAPSMTRFHRPGCVLVGNKDVRSLDRAEAERGHLGACRVCRP